MHGFFVLNIFNAYFVAYWLNYSLIKIFLESNVNEVSTFINIKMVVNKYL